MKFRVAAPNGITPELLASKRKSITDAAPAPIARAKLAARHGLRVITINGLPPAISGDTIEIHAADAAPLLANNLLEHVNV